MLTWSKATLSLLEGKDTPASLAGLRDSLLAAVHSLEEQVLPEGDPRAQAFVENQLLVDRSQAFAIIGGRGSGKSTLLLATCGKLLSETNDLVLPILRPELLGESDSLLKSFLSELWEVLNASSEDSSWSFSAVDRDDITRRLAEASRSYAASQMTAEALAQGTDHPSDFADDSLFVSRSRVRLAKQIRSLTNLIRQSDASGGQNRLIIVPVDDADLAPERSLEILNDLHILGSVPGVVPIVCFDYGDFTNSWMAARKNPYITDQTMHIWVRQYFDKVFPYRTRFEIEPIADADKKTFSPVSEGATLVDKLGTLRRLVERQIESAWPIDESLTRSKEVFQLGNPLPSSPRTLVQLWESLDILDESDQPDPAALYVALGRLLQVLSTVADLRMESATGRAVEILPGKDGTEGWRRVTAGLSGITLFISAVGAREDSSGSIVGSATRPESQRPVATITLRPLHAVRASRRRADDSETSRSSTEREHLGQDSVTALLAIKEVYLGSGLFDAEQDDSLYLGMSEWSFLQQIRVGGKETDDLFLHLPDAKTLNEVIRAGLLWNLCARKDQTQGTEGLLATLTRASNLTLSDQPTDDLLASFEEVDYETAFREAVSLYRQAATRRTSRDLAYREWFELQLPMQWHSALLPNALIRDLCAEHLRVVAGVEHIESNKVTIEEAFDRRIKRIIESGDFVGEAGLAKYAWLGGYFEVVQAFGSDYMDELIAVHPVFQRSLAGLKAGGSVVAENLDIHESARLAMAPYETPEGTRLLMAAERALEKAVEEETERSLARDLSDVPNRAK